MEKIECTQHQQAWKVTESELSDLPLSKYRMGNYYPIMEISLPVNVVVVGNNTHLEVLFRSIVEYRVNNGYSSALQGDVQKHINGPRTCTDTFKSI